MHNQLKDEDLIISTDGKQLPLARLDPDPISVKLCPRITLCYLKCSH